VRKKKGKPQSNRATRKNPSKTRYKNAGNRYFKHKAFGNEDAAKGASLLGGREQGPLEGGGRAGTLTNGDEQGAA